MLNLGQLIICASTESLVSHSVIERTGKMCPCLQHSTMKIKDLERQIKNDLLTRRSFYLQYI
jgi:hypothetical protein